MDQNTPKIFKPNFFNRLVFNKLYGSCCTRCFGYGVPYTCMVPMGDFQNHSDKEANSYEMINLRQHLRPDLLDKTIANNTYFSREKYLNNYELIFKPNEMKYYANTIHGGAFNREAYQINEHRRTIEYQRGQLSADKQIWEVPFRVVDIEEDNDTEDDDDASDEQEQDRRIKMNYTEGTQDAIKTAKNMGVLKQKLMKLDFYIEKDSLIEGLDGLQGESEEGDKGDG